MKRTIVAILALSPAVFHGQAKTLAQPGSTPVLHTSLVQPMLSPANAEATAATLPALRISTGLVAPKLIHTVAIKSSDLYSSTNAARERTAAVSMTVDENGRPQNVKIVQTADPLTDRNVLAAVNEFRYQPATLNGTPVAVEETLSLIIDKK